MKDFRFHWRILTVLFVCLIAFVFACKKDVFNDSDFGKQITSPVTKPDSPLTFRSNEEDDSLKLTILGAQRNNPFTVTMMAQAHNDIHGTTYSELETTDLYIKFTPANMEELMLVEDSEIEWFDFPLDYEIIEMGDYYSTSSNFEEMPEMYAVVKPAEVLPNVPYQVLAELHLESTDTNVIKKAFEFTNNEWRGEGSPESECTPSDPNYPYCLCQPGWVHWPDCFTEPDFDWGPWLGGSGGGGTPFNTNACGCNIPLNSRRPAGCIKVQDDVKQAMEGVRDVRVIWYNGWFTIKKTQTNDNGCWEISLNESGNGYMWVKFKSDKCKIRGTADNWKKLWQWRVAIKDYVGKFGAPPYNNILVEYYEHTLNNQGEQDHRYWGAATVNNALHEFHDYAIAEGIDTPPNKLDVLIGVNSDFGYALMSTQFTLAATAAAALTTSTFYTGPFAPIIGIIGGAVLLKYMPDVFVGVNFENSDVIKSLAYHEFAHASHYEKAGHNFWEDLATSEIFAGGHGNSNSNGADIIEVAESWAEHIGLSLAHENYPPGSNTALFGSYEEELERTRNESENHIPIGFYHDLIDGFNDTVNACEQLDQTSCGPIDDQASGFTNTQLFEHLDGGTRSMETYRLKVTVGVSSSVETQITNLLDSY